jgi:hypothetical protein
VTHRFTRFALGLAVAAVLASACNAAPTSPTSSSPLEGAWVLVSTTNTSGGSANAPGNRVKVFAGATWSITQTDPNTGTIIYRHGGSYTLIGRNYAETVEYAGASTASLIGRTFHFEMNINADEFTQVGIDNPYTETWRRR